MEQKDLSSAGDIIMNKIMRMEKTMKEAVKTIKTKEQAVHIIYASNDGYAGHLAASLCSLLDNNRHIKKSGYI